VLAYLKENPSTSFTLRNLGSKLPKWLEGHPELAAQTPRSSCGRCETGMGLHRSLSTAPAFTPLSNPILVSLTADSRLSLQPHLQLLDLCYPVDELILAVHRENTPAGIVSNPPLNTSTESKQNCPRCDDPPVVNRVH